MTFNQHLASHVYRYFTQVNPTDQQRDHLADQVETTSNVLVKVLSNKYLVIDDRILHPEKGGPNDIMVFYTSCHAYQFIRYLTTYRPEVLEDYLIVILYNHLLINARPHFDLNLLQLIMGRAAVVITNPFSEKFGDLSLHSLMVHYDPRTQTDITFVPPSVSHYWPVSEHFGEEPVARYIYNDGTTANEMIDQYLRGRFICMFSERSKRQMDRLGLRGQNCDVQINKFIHDHQKTHKMFFTSNHPTFHLIGHIMDGCLKLIGYDAKGDDFNLALPTNGGEMRNHNPETQYEWDFYEFQYPRRYTTDWGGENMFYPAIIKRVAEKLKTIEKAAELLNFPPEEPL